ncbi:MAG: hypothetical protein Q8R42_03445 [Desulfocapsaceae bacterium]|nr:hypothetical protein [Desulfocapsaceae bacterium]
MQYKHGGDARVAGLDLGNYNGLRKSTEWLYVIAELMEICATQPFVDYQQTIEIVIESKKKRLEEVIRHCRKNESPVPSHTLKMHSRTCLQRFKKTERQDDK